MPINEDVIRRWSECDRAATRDVWEFVLNQGILGFADKLMGRLSKEKRITEGIFDGFAFLEDGLKRIKKGLVKDSSSFSYRGENEFAGYIRNKLLYMFTDMIGEGKTEPKKVKVERRTVSIDEPIESKEEEGLTKGDVFLRDESSLKDLFRGLVEEETKKKIQPFLQSLKQKSPQRKILEAYLERWDKIAGGEVDGPELSKEIMEELRLNENTFFGQRRRLKQAWEKFEKQSFE